MPSANTPSAETFDALAATALLGTARNASLPPPPPPLDSLLAPAQSPEQSLLATAAALDLLHRAGTIPQTLDAPPNPAPPDSLPPLSPASASHLRILLDGNHEGVLPEFLTHAAEKQKRVPHPLLPALLNLATRDESLREKILPILGPRAPWLAAQNPDWQPLFSPPDPATFETADKKDRLALLKSLRKSDPAAARQLLEKSWPTESADDRARFLPLLLSNLSIADEPFLEAALDDKRKEVREAAADLLARLPQSRYGFRMVQRAARLLTATTRQKAFAVLHRVKFILNVDLPDTAPDLERDLPASLSARDLGEKAARLASILAAAPLTTFANFPPTSFIAAAADHDHAAALLLGWSRAAIRQKNIPWAEALLAHWFRDSDDKPLHDAHSLARELTALLPPDNREALLTPALLENWQVLDDLVLLDALEAATHPFSEKFSRVLLAALAKSLANQNTYRYQARTYTEKRAALFLHPTVAAEIPSLPATATASEPNARAFDTLHTTLAFRKQMLEELQK